MEYNHERIELAITAATRTRKACRKIAMQYAPVPLPENVIARICTRRKLWNYLAALDLSNGAIQSIFWSHKLAVPRDRSLKQSTRKIETKPEWLEQI